MRRLVELRGMTEEDARARVASQASDERRLAIADVVIETDGELVGDARAGGRAVGAALERPCGRSLVGWTHGTDPCRPAVRGHQRVHALRRPAEGHPRADRGARPRRDRRGAARRDRHRQERHDRVAHRAGAAADARARAQQDARRAARATSSASFFPNNAVEYFVSLLRLLPAGGVHPADATPTSRRTRRSTTRSTGCGTRRRTRCSSAPRRRRRRRPSRASTASARPRSTSRRWSRCRSGRRDRPRRRCCAASSRCSTSATTWPSRAARSACAATRSRSSRRTRSTRSAIEFFGDEIEALSTLRPAHRRDHRDARAVSIFPGSHYVTPAASACSARSERSATSSTSGSTVLERESKLLEAQRLAQRTIFDLEMMRGDRLLLRHRELLAPHRRARARASRRTACSTTSPTTSSS